jgi:UDP-N-acetylmuramoylalanine--D-glutamate ligase
MTAEAPAQVMKFSSCPVKNGKTVFLDGETIYWNNGIDTKKIVDTQELKIRGRHNIGNLMAAAGACFAYGLTLAEVRRGILEFKGVPHRLEFVRELAGVKYYNDTAATIPEAAISALDSFLEPIVLIAGGNDKGLQYAQFAKTIMDKPKSVVFIKGTGTDKILTEIAKLPGGAEKEYPVVTYMHEAVALAKDLAEKGDVVLLSSGTASFGVFQNEFDRGDKFKKAVLELK